MFFISIMKTHISLKTTIWQSNWKINTCKSTSSHTSWHTTVSALTSHTLFSCTRKSNLLAQSRKPLAMSLRQYWVNQWSRTGREKQRGGESERVKEGETIIHWEVRQRTAGPRHTRVRTNNSSPPKKWDKTLEWPTFHCQWTSDTATAHQNWSASHP